MSQPLGTGAAFLLWLGAVVVLRRWRTWLPYYFVATVGFTGRDLLHIALPGAWGAWSPLYVGAGPLLLAGVAVARRRGVFGGTWLIARFTRAELDEDLAWSDVAGLACLSGLGFTVSLLIGELAFGAGSDRDDHVKVAVLLGSLLAAVIAAVLLRRRNAHYRAVEARESADDDGDGVPDVYLQHG